MRTRASCFHSPTPSLQPLLRPTIDAFPDPEQSDAPKSASKRHYHGCTRIVPTIRPASAAASLSSLRLVTVSYPPTEPPHPPSWPMNSIAAGTTILRKRARPDPCLVLTKQSDLWKFCNTVFWSERRRSRIGSH